MTASKEEPYDIGLAIGKIIVELVDIIAAIDGSSRESVLEELFSAWWTAQIRDAE